MRAARLASSSERCAATRRRKDSMSSGSEAALSGTQNLYHKRPKMPEKPNDSMLFSTRKLGMPATHGRAPVNAFKQHRQLRRRQRYGSRRRSIVLATDEPDVKASPMIASFCSTVQSAVPKRARQFEHAPSNYSYDRSYDCSYPHHFG